MPNTLAHFGAQGLACTLLAPHVSARWVLVGCVLPDVPWILARLLRWLLWIDPYEAYLYASVQASLAGCLLLGCATASLSRRPAPVFLILGSNAVVHLLLDALQVKWATGVHLLAPWSWKPLRIGLFWPESLATYVLTAMGIAYLAVAWRRRRSESRRGDPISPRLVVVASLVLAVYLIAPFGLMRSVEASDVRFIRTLRSGNERTGRAVEFDRVHLRYDGERAVIDEPTGDELTVIGVGGARPRMVSFRGVFVDARTIRVEELHEHSPWFRDTASYVGLSLLTMYWVGSLLRAPKGPAVNVT